MISINVHMSHTIEMAQSQNCAKPILSSYEKDFELTFTHNSTAIEGNTLTLMETKVVLEDGISVGGKELREIYEVVNHKKAYQYVKKCIAEGKILDEPIVKDIHAILTENIIVGGIYRNQEVRISGAGHVPPVGNGRYLSQKKIDWIITMPWKPMRYEESSENLQI